MKQIGVVLIMLLITKLFVQGCNSADGKKMVATDALKPNIVLIMVDDMGYSDLGSYGGEIPTPNIDELAENGLRFTRFYNTSRCCPTRAALLTGLAQHQTGIGHMTNNERLSFDYGEDGYRGKLNDNCVTMAEVLQKGGYSTYMTGKWHLGLDMEDRPLQRGFDKFYGNLRGAFNYFKQGPFYSWGNEILEEPTDTNYYATDAFTDSANVWIKDQPKNEPFFLYVAYNAPHWPLHAKEEDVDRFKGKYLIGWDSVRQARLQRQVDLGIFDESMGLAPRDENVRPWSEVNEAQKERSDYRMAVYAAQIYSIDQNVGKLVATLKNTGQFENTLILFLSDNGACAEPYSEFGGGKFFQVNNPDFAGIRSVGRGWANASNTPLHSYKNRPYEGGIATPFIAYWPSGISSDLNGTFLKENAHITDLMPTVLDLAQVTYPEERQGKVIPPYAGKSLIPFFESGERTPAEFLFFEHENRCAAISGDWKIIADFDTFNWELYDLSVDRIEQNNLASQHPDVVEELAAAWHEWAKSTQVIPKGTWEGRGYNTPKK